MRYCTECGDLLVERPTDTSWEEIMDCEYCNLRHHTTYGDHMGGSSDNIRIYSYTPETDAMIMARTLNERLKGKQSSGKRLQKLLTITDEECREIIRLLEDI